MTIDIEISLSSGTLLVTISQSGETADTLAALRYAKKLNYTATLAVCNVATSSLVRESDFSVLTMAGQEIGVSFNQSLHYSTSFVVNLIYRTCEKEWFATCTRGKASEGFSKASKINR